MTKPNVVEMGEEIVVPYNSIGSYPRRTGNLVTPLIDGIPSFGRIKEPCDDAKKDIFVMVAYYSSEFPADKRR